MFPWNHNHDYNESTKRQMFLPLACGKKKERQQHGVSIYKEKYRQMVTLRDLDDYLWASLIWEKKLGTLMIICEHL